MKYEPKLDGVRGVAILGVLLVHCEILRRYFSGGKIGVDLFFVLSGYLITTILAEEFDGTGVIDFKRFYLRRILRLYPALLVCTLLTGIFFPWIWPVSGAEGYPGREAFPRIAGAALFYAANLVRFNMAPLNHFWSLAVEEQFYVVWPLLLAGIILKRTGRTRVVLVTVLIVLFAVGRWGLFLHGVALENLQRWPFTRADSLMCGAWVAFALKIWPSLFKNAALLRFALIVANFLLVYVLLTPARIDGWLTSYGYTLVSLACAVLIIVAVRPTAPAKPACLMEKFNALAVPVGGALVYAWGWVDLASWLENVIFCAVVTGGLGAMVFWSEKKRVDLFDAFLRMSWLRWIGRRSYGIYLYHLPLFFAIGNVPLFYNSRDWRILALLVVVQFAAAFAVAWLSYKYVEAPFLAMKNRWAVTKRMRQFRLQAIGRVHKDGR